MPQLITIRVSNPRGQRIRLWIPLLPLLLVASPLLLLAAVAGFVACLIYRINAIRALYTSWRLFSALRGTHVNVEQGRQVVLVDIR